jgi:hypothetical protein
MLIFSFSCHADISYATTLFSYCDIIFIFAFFALRYAADCLAAFADATPLLKSLSLRHTPP